MSNRDRLTAVRFTAVPDGTPVDVRSGRGARVLFALHGSACDACVRYLLDEIAPSTKDLGDWNGRVTAVVPAGDAGAVALAERIAGRVQVVEDTSGAFATGDARVLVSDEWGEVYFAGEPGPGHDFPPAAELIDWARFISIQCPECVGGPEGGWAGIQ